MPGKIPDEEKGLMSMSPIGNNNKDSSSGVGGGSSSISSSDIWHPLPGGKTIMEPEAIQLLQSPCSDSSSKGLLSGTTESSSSPSSRFKPEIIKTTIPDHHIYPNPKRHHTPSPLASPSISSTRSSSGRGANFTNSKNSRPPILNISDPDDDIILSPNESTTPRSTFLRHLPFNGMAFIYGQTLNSVEGSKLKNKISSKFGRMRKRVVYKNGECNLYHTKISKRNRRFMKDIFTTLVDIQWRFTLLIFVLSFLLSWLGFAMIWWLICFTHGDLEPQNLPGGSENSEWSPCVGNFVGFTSAFLFSIETQHTIGYGSRYTTEECPVAVFVMCVQSILGVMIQAAMVGIVFAKMSRPKKRTQTLMFSRYGAICQRDGELCLIFRVGDMRKSHIICANVRAHLMKRKVTAEGETLPYYHYELKVGVDSDLSQIFFIWPMLVVHKIDKDSPLYGVSASDLLDEKFEIILILEGVIESTGATTQARTSYLPSEILWGHRFEQLITFRKELSQYAVDYTLFHHTYEYDTPVCSAKELDELKALEDEMKRKGIKMIAPFHTVPSAAIESSTRQ